MTALYLCSIVVHGQHAEHVQSVSTFDEFPHSVWRDTLASLICWRRLVAGRIGQLIHADDAVLRGTQAMCLESQLLNKGQQQHIAMFTI